MKKCNSEQKCHQEKKPPKDLKGMSTFYGINLDDEQIIFRDAIWNRKNIAVLCNAKAGTGKTTIALGVANLMYQYKMIDGIVYFMSPVQEGTLGFMPGDVNDKTKYYMQPLYDACEQLNINPNTAIITDIETQRKLNQKPYITCATDTFVRGCNFKNKAVIIDEAQNFHFDNLKKTLTRLHDDCKAIIIGHTGQCDMRNNDNGFAKYIEAFSNSGVDWCQICELKNNHRGKFSTFVDSVCDSNYFN